MNNGGAVHFPIPSAEPRLSAQSKRVASKPWRRSIADFVRSGDYSQQVLARWAGGQRIEP